MISIQKYMGDHPATAKSGFTGEFDWDLNYRFLEVAPNGDHQLVLPHARATARLQGVGGPVPVVVINCPLGRDLTQIKYFSGGVFSGTSIIGPYAIKLYLWQWGGTADVDGSWKLRRVT